MNVHDSSDAKPSTLEVEGTSETRPSLLTRKDKAAELLDQYGGRVVVTPEDDRRILRMIDMRILPILLTVYCLQYLDKATISYASVFGLIKDTNLHGEEYSWLSSIVYLAQLVCQPLVAFFLVKLPTGKFVAVMVLCWGIVLCCMVAAKTFTGLLISRMFLGACESAVAPAFIAIVQMWYRRGEQTVRNAFWYAMLGVVGMFGSLLTYGLGHINSDTLHSYQIIFLFCGGLTLLFSIVIFLFMPDSPMEARFFSQQDKLLAIERLRMNQMGVASRTWRNDHVWDAFKDPKSYLWFSMLFSISIPSGGISTFGPLIIKSFGFNKFDTILFNIPFGALQIVATVGGAYLATYWNRKGIVLALLCVPPIIGCIILLALPHVPAHKGALLTGYYLISFYPGITPLIYSWSSQNTAGDTKRKVTTAILFVGASAGNVVGPTLYTTEEAPGYTRGLSSNLALFCILIILFGLTTAWLMLLNRKHAKTRVALGKKGEDIVDLSVQSRRSARKRNRPVSAEVGAIESQKGEGVAEVEDQDVGVGVGEKAFDDVTDLRNEDFIYVY